MQVYVVRALAFRQFDSKPEPFVRVFENDGKALDCADMMREQSRLCVEKYGFPCYTEVRFNTVTVE